MRSKFMIIRVIVALIVLVIGLVGGWYWWQRFSPTSASHVSFSHDAVAGKENIIPVAVIGSGPAGLSAALYTSRANLFTVIFQGKMPGGQLMSTSYIENWPGIPKIMGPKVMKTAEEQATKWGAVTAAESIVKVDFSTWPYTLWTDNGTKVHALVVILAMGANPKKKGIPGEEEYWGRGVSTCAVCDAPFFKDSDIVIIGGGDSAAEEALQLASYARHITIAVRGKEMRASRAMQEHLKAYKHIEVRYNTDVTRIIGDEHFVTGIETVANGVTSAMKIDGVFLAIGHVPNTDFIRSMITTDQQGYVILHPSSQQTSIRGVFAAGDVADKRYRQAGVAAGDGIKAALDAAAFLRDIDMNDEFLRSLQPHFFNPEKEGKRRQLPAISTKAELDQLLAAHELVLLDFFTPTCYSCMQMLPALEGAYAELGDTVYCAKVDASVSLELAQHLVVPKVPTIILFKHGKLAARTKDIMNKREIIDFIMRIAKA